MDAGPSGLSRAEKLARLRLWRTPRVGPATYGNLISRFGDAQTVLNELPGHIRAMGRTPPPIPDQDSAIAEIEALHRLGGRFIFAGGPEFPTLLTHIQDCPPVLATLGNMDLLHDPAVAIVGSRNASLSGKTLTHTYAEGLGAAGFRVVSGLAKGIDTAAHQAALKTGTIAVVAGGIDVIYPRENTDLYHQIANQGLIISEQPLGMPTSARLFPLRNRLVSGLALGTLVMEANARSGSLITARLAGEQGREVMAVPGSPLDGRAEGANALLKQGATLISNLRDILEVLDSLPGPGFREPLGRPYADPPPIVPSNPASKPQDLNPLKNRILNALSSVAISIDALSAECDGSAALMQPALADLEIAGLIDRQPGGLVALKT